MRASRPTMRAWCQHCDATELIKPEEIYSPEFNFWCPRCQSILILQDDTGQIAFDGPAFPAPDPDESAAIESELEDPRQAPTKEDDPDPPSTPVDVTVAEPEAEPVSRDRKRTVSVNALDAYQALAAELDGGIANDEVARPTRRLDGSSGRERPTERGWEPKRSGSLPRTRADSEGPDAGRPNGLTNGHATPAPGPDTSVRQLADLARNLDQPGPTPTSRSMKRPVPGPAPRPATGSIAKVKSGTDSGPIMARETVRVTRPPLDPRVVASAVGRKDLEQRIGEAIAPAAPPLPNWDGGDTQQVRELARAVPTPTPPEPTATAPPKPAAPRPEPAAVVVEPVVAEPVDEELAPEEPVDDALETIAVVAPISGTTTGTGSRTYERADEVPAAADEAEPEADEPAADASRAAAPPAAKPASTAEDLDWYALLDEALPEAEGEGDTDSSRVVIRLPETMAPTSEADAEQVRQLQAKLEARGLHGVGDESAVEHPAKKLDSKKVRELAGEEDEDTDSIGHGGAKEDETKDYVTSPGKKKDDDETRDHLHRNEATGAIATPKVDPDAPTTAGDPERTAQLRADATEAAAEARQSESRRVARAETGRTASDRRPRSGPVKAGIVIEQFNRSDLDPGLVCARDTSSPEADYFKQLYQRIFHSRNGSSPRVVLVTSASKGEGKTTVAANLALVAARMPGRGALLVGADPRGGDLLRTFGLRMKAEGLLEALESGKDPTSYILQFKLGMLDVLPLGVPGSDAAELISSDRVGELVRNLSNRYPNSVVIIDGSSILHAPDPLVLARHVDGVVLVVRADVTPRDQIERARDLIGGEKVLGVVLNQVGS